MDFRIVRVFDHDCHLTFQVEHFNADETFWFSEHYLFQGREGLCHQRMENASGELIMDNGEVAPTRLFAKSRAKAQFTDAENKAFGLVDEQYLPDGRDWAYQTTPYLDVSSVLAVIGQSHSSHLVSGLPAANTVDVLHSMRPSERDRLGCDSLLLKFQHLVGYSA